MPACHIDSASGIPPKPEGGPPPPPIPPVTGLDGIVRLPDYPPITPPSTPPKNPPPPPPPSPKPETPPTSPNKSNDFSISCCYVSFVWYITLLSHTACRWHEPDPDTPTPPGAPEPVSPGGGKPWGGEQNKVHEKLFIASCSCHFLCISLSFRTFHF